MAFTLGYSWSFQTWGVYNLGWNGCLRGGILLFLVQMSWLLMMTIEGLCICLVFCIPCLRHECSLTLYVIFGWGWQDWPVVVVLLCFGIGYIMVPLCFGIGYIILFSHLKLVIRSHTAFRCEIHVGGNSIVILLYWEICNKKCCWLLYVEDLCQLEMYKVTTVTVM